MNAHQFKTLTDQGYATKTICAEQLVNKEPRTLIFGYTTDRDTFHLYLDEKGVLNRVVYDYDGLLLGAISGTLELSHCIPSKRAYPERCDFEFCNLLQQAGAHISFTTFDKATPDNAVHGKRLEDLINRDTGFLTSCVPVTEAELGLMQFAPSSRRIGAEVFREARKTVDIRLQSYLRDRIIRKEPANVCGRGLQTLCSGVETTVENCLAHHGVSMVFRIASDVAAALTAKVAALAEEIVAKETAANAA